MKALKEKGFDRVGRRIPDPGQTETIPDPNDDLRGSLTIMLRSECLTAGFGEVQKDLSKLLGRLLWILKNEREGEGKEMYRREKSK